MQDKSQWPTYPDQGDYKKSKEREQQGQSDECLHYHEPYRQQPLSYDIIFLRKYMVAAIKLLIKLIVRIAELLKAIFPEPHMLKVTERFLIWFYPIRTENVKDQSTFSYVLFSCFKLILISLFIAVTLEINVSTLWMLSLGEKVPQMWVLRQKRQHLSIKEKRISTGYSSKHSTNRSNRLLTGCPVIILLVHRHDDLWKGQCKTDRLV